MTKRYTQWTVWIEPEAKTALAAIKLRDGLNVSEQVRRAIAAWLRERDRPASAVAE